MLIECKSCDAPNCEGCNIFILSTMLKKGKLNFLMGKDHTVIDIDNLNLDKDDVDNLIEFFELAFFDHLKNLLDVGDLDNMAYLGSMYKIYESLIGAKLNFEKKG